VLDDTFDCLQNPATMYHLRRQLGSLLSLILFLFEPPKWIVGHETQNCESGSSSQSCQTLQPNLNPDDGGPVRPSLEDFAISHQNWLAPPPPKHSKSEYMSEAMQQELDQWFPNLPRRSFANSRLSRDLRKSFHGNRDAQWEAACTLASMMVVPQFTEVGYQVIKIPREIYNDMRDLVLKGLDAGQAKPDKYEHRKTIGIGAWSDAEGIVHREPNLTLYITQPFEQAKRVMEVIKPMAEEFIGVQLQIKAHHGFRVYTRNNQMYYHTDKVFSLPIGVNMVILQQTEEPWPFDIYNHQTDQIDRLWLKDGEMVIYEAVGNLHARPQPLRGDYCISVLFHFTLAEGWPYQIPHVLHEASKIMHDWDSQNRSNAADEAINIDRWYSAGQGKLFHL